MVFVVHKFNGREFGVNRDYNYVMSAITRAMISMTIVVVDGIFNNLAELTLKGGKSEVIKLEQ